jgi:MerR family redox-sensitive transcriptional activator SoxR
VSTLLSIGELSSCTGVATSALRYYEEIGLVRPVKRVSQQRRYNESAVDIIGVVLLLRGVGFYPCRGQEDDAVEASMDRSG